MSTLVLYTSRNRPLDLAKLTERHFALISLLQYKIKHGDRILLCQRLRPKMTEPRYSSG
ncbi:Uncharacterised protein [Amycolatopsis camponoti]|uniref:Uncharacterized protein n=1 Tax=Amycolatopsis camponoti TaxID=2606593 RepID=A0A6I8LWV3_9PSEU|nr:hypothetical protein [Amycolatopsis camponoti]VVJ21620.1 Uncharacterised protein [Amycolatopsis camponoti]